MTSKLEFYSVAIVTEDKEIGSDVINCYPVEVLPQVHGVIKDSTKDYKVKVPNATGVQQNGKLKSESTLTATWLGLGCGSRNTAPDVVKSESVLLFQYADTGEYRWEKIGREPSLRRLEKVLYLYGGTKEFGVDLNKTNSYWLDVDTYNGNITFHTSMANGEPHTYDVIFDTLSGRVSVKDDAGNSIVLSSSEGSVSITAKTIKLTGNVEVEGNVSIKGNSSITGNSDVTGNSNTGGTVTGGDGLNHGLN
jgi:hypothetical protein